MRVSRTSRRWGQRSDGLLSKGYWGWVVLVEGISLDGPMVTVEVKRWQWV